MRLLASAVGWDYPSIHGEHCTTYQHYHLSLGSSPLVRGAHGCRIVGLCNLRIIPARAGSTWTRSSSWTTGRDHPRSCGEHNDPSDGSNVASGSSPLVRGARLVAVSFEVPFGIIPARGFSVGDHPRSCGEHTPLYFSLRSIWGSSPLVRGAPRDGDGCAVRAGIIPARAGSTTLPGPPASGRGDHPRSCGEHWLNHQHRTWSEGSSPLVRGARAPSWCLFSAHGIIPARAGSTNMYYQTHPILQDHPRSCGEHSSLLISSLCVGGSSPLVRGALSRGI